ncbi:MAG: M56 family metallopeptidase [Planctomycetaceae bacterium]
MSSFHFLEIVTTLFVQVSLVIGLTWAITHVVRGEKWRCHLWTCAYGLILLLAGLAVATPHPRLFHPWNSYSTESLVTLAEVEQKGGHFLFIAWSIGFLVSFGMMLIRHNMVSRFLNRCQKLEQYSEEGTKLYRRLEAGAGGIGRLTIQNRPVKILVSTEVSTPFCWQFHNPVVVLPEYLIGFEVESVEHIVRHELEHLQTGHPMQLFLQRLVEALFWFHPLVWWASRQSDLHREFACDEAAINSKQEIVAYLRTLLTIVEYTTSRNDQLPSSLNFSRGKQVIARRAERLVALASTNHPNSRLFVPRKLALSCLVFLSLLCSLLWLPLNVLASPRSNWSPWPKWSASLLHDLGLPVRDFEVFNQRTELIEMHEQLNLPEAEAE